MDIQRQQKALTYTVYTLILFHFISFSRTFISGFHFQQIFIIPNIYFLRYKFNDCVVGRYS